jgi:hypothetical protein
MPQINHCNRCQTGAFEFVGHQYDVKKDSCVSVYKCVDCGALHLQPWKPSFDIEDPRAVRSMVPTDNYMDRIRKYNGWTP